MRKRKAVIAAAAVAILAGLAIVCVLLFSHGDGSRYARVPSVVGMSYTRANAMLKKAGLNIEIDPRLDIEEKAALGRKIEDQQPSKGTQAAKGSAVTVVLVDVPVKATETPPPPQTAPAQAASEAAPEPAPSPEPAPAPAASPAPAPAQAAETAPMDGSPIYPFTSNASISCGHWSGGSQDYPYFGAPRNNGNRNHAGIDVYPPGGPGTAVKAIKAGTVVKVAPFYTRASGEVTYGIMIDHGDWVANYAEVHPSVDVGERVAIGQKVGTVSGTAQLHFEVYAPGTRSWSSWYGEKPANLIDGTDLMLRLY